jgi:hypothetical protein
MGGPGAIGSANSGSLFRVGESISVANVLVFVSLLVVFIVVLEQLLHKLEHSAKRSRKHEEMVRKVYRELMILGFPGVAIKVYKEITHVSAYSDAIVAFQCADLTIFILAVALILQAICVFLALRHESYELEEAELLTSSDLARTIAQREQQQQSQRLLGWPLWWFTSCKPKDKSESETQDLVELRVLRHLFLRRYGLPELFPFSKYVRQAQDNQITHMIDVEISMWLLLLGVAWVIDGAIVLLQRVDGFHAESHAIVLVFLIFSWSLVALHVLVAVFFRNGIVKLLRVEGLTHQQTTVACLEAIALEENAALHNEMASDALLVMQEVQERQDAKYSAMKRQRRGKHRYLVERGTGFQLLATAGRHAVDWFVQFRRGETKPRVHSDALSTVTADTPTTSIDFSPTPHHHPQEPNRRGSAELSVQIQWLSRKAWQFVVMVIVMLNGLYLALLCQCIFYQLGLLSTYSSPLRAVIVVGLPLPVIINMVLLQPQILRNFMIVASILQVDVATLSKVVTHFSEIVELRTEFARTCLECLEAAGVSQPQFKLALEMKDGERSGRIELEQLRCVLRSVGFRLSYFRFNSVSKLLFQLKGATVEYAQVLRMIALAQQRDGDELFVATVNDQRGMHTLPHHTGHVLLRQSVFVEGGDAQDSFPEPATEISVQSTHVASVDSVAEPESARAGATSRNLLKTVSETTMACDSQCNHHHHSGMTGTEDATAMQRHRPVIRRRSSFQNTSVRTLRSLYFLSNCEAAGPEHDANDLTDPNGTVSIGLDDGEAPTSVYVRM